MACGWLGISITIVDVRVPHCLLSCLDSSHSHLTIENRPVGQEEEENDHHPSHCEALVIRHAAAVTSL